MKKSLKMRLLCGVLFLSAFVSAAFASCAEKTKETEKSALRGTFTYQGSRSVFFSSDRTTSDALYLDTAIYAGFDTFLNGGAYCNYKVDLKLKLSNDYSYQYNYSVVMGDANGSNDFCKMIVSVSGTFTYVEKEGNQEVSLSLPTGGTQQIYGIRVPGVWGGKGICHDEADMVQDFSYADCFADYDYTYVQARTVYVNRAEKTVSDGLLEFNPLLFNEMAKYVTY